MQKNGIYISSRKVFLRAEKRRDKGKKKRLLSRLSLKGSLQDSRKKGDLASQKGEMIYIILRGGIHNHTRGITYGKV